MSQSPDPTAGAPLEPETAVSLSDVLIAFQKSLSRAQSQSATVKHTPEFFLGERALLDIEALDIELKVGFSVGSPREDLLKVNFQPAPESASMVKFRVKVRPTEAMGSGVVIMRPPNEGTEGTSRICIITFAQGRAVPSKVDLHLVGRWIPTVVKEKVDPGPVDLPPAPEGTEPITDPDTRAILIPNVTTDVTGRCVVHAEISGQEIKLTVNGTAFFLKPDWAAAGDMKPGTTEYLQQTMIRASIGSSESDIIELFPSKKP